MNQPSSSTAQRFVFTDALWDKASAHFTGNLYHPRNTRKVLETILYIAQDNSGWALWTQSGMPTKLTLQRYIHVWHNNGTLAKILNTVNRSATKKVPLSNVLALLSETRKTKNTSSRPAYKKKAPVKVSMSIEDAIELVIKRCEHTSFIKSQIFDEVKAIVPKVHSLTVYANLQKRIRYGTLHGSLDSMIYQPYPKVELNSSSSYLDDSEKVAATILPLPKEPEKKVDNNYGFKKGSYVGKAVPTQPVHTSDALGLAWKTFLETYAKAHWTKKKNMARTVSGWAFGELNKYPAK